MELGCLIKIMSVQNQLKTFGEFDQFMRDIQHLFPLSGDRLHLYAFGIGEEAGEVLGKFKRMMREGGDHKEEILLELGDLLGYMSCLAQELGSNLDEVVSLNHDKIESRRLNQTLTGKGDYR
jgi:NTP pyrophosphatase (non-canonical NTP hydrolase)